MKSNNLLENLTNLLFNLADVLSIILPVLLGVAFMTIIERKQLAAHQRRVGPNTVGWINKKKRRFTFTPKGVRDYHSSFARKNNEILNTLFKNRINSSINNSKIFDSKIIDTCFNLTSLKERTIFFNKFKGLSEEVFI